MIECSPDMGRSTFKSTWVHSKYLQKFKNEYEYKYLHSAVVLSTSTSTLVWYTSTVVWYSSTLVWYSSTILSTQTVIVKVNQFI